MLLKIKNVELVDKTKRIQKNFMVAIAFILRKHVDEIFLSLLHDAFLTIERLRFTFTAYGKRQTSVENFSE